ncbi:hypothetical protein BDQ17DRAFT_1346617 [Cyathus striatus]|nr:hypothetical protein BDQ17DRAFT_1346617 [Cyathus striatus]
MTDSVRIIDTATPVLSFPAILRNPGLNNRYAHLEGTLSPARNNSPPTASAVAKKRLREQNEGKRWVRRKDNVKFVGNPHVVAPTKKDYGVQTPQTRPTFPEPLPPYLPRTSKVPSLTVPAVTDPNSANAGRFSLSLKGMRRDLRRAGGRAQTLVRDVEDVIVGWLQAGGIVLAPDTTGKLPSETDDPGVMIGNTGSIHEVSRSPLQLVWRIRNDAFTRYVVHCCARYHEVVSFSTSAFDLPLRPNVTRPDHHAVASLETPPVTDIDYSSQQSDLEIDSDFVSEHELELSGIDSEHEGDSHIPQSHDGLEAIREGSAPPSPGPQHTLPDEGELGDGWSAVEDIDADADDSASEFGLDSAVASLSLGRVSSSLREDVLSESDTLTEVNVPVSNRDTSSPSRSPIRMYHPRRRVGKRHLAGVIVDPNGRTSFYDYLFA